jgi:tRNA(adenine34) deaminase
MTQHERVDSEHAKMGVALEQARLAQAVGEVPVGAAVFLGERLIAKAHNLPVSSHNPCAHAEILALQEAGRQLGNYRLEGCTLFVTLEPCVMCAGAILNSRIKRLVFGATDERAGAAGSVINVFDNPSLNSHTQVQSGFMADDCAKPLVDFFKLRRVQSKVVREQTQQYLREDALRPEMLELKRLMSHWQEAGLVSVYVNDLSSHPGLRLHHWDMQAQKTCAPLPTAPDHEQKTWLCLHGLGSSGAFFAPWAIERARLGERVLMPDLMGFGLSDHLRNAARFDLHAQVLLLEEWFDRMNLKRVHLMSHDWSAQLALSLVPRLGSKVASWLCLNPNLNLSSSALERHDPPTTWQRGVSSLSLSKAGRQGLLGLQPHLSEEQIAFLLSQLPLKATSSRAKLFDQLVLKPSTKSPLGLDDQEMAFWASAQAPSVFCARTRALPWSGEGVHELHVLAQCLPSAKHLEGVDWGDFWSPEVFQALSVRLNALA